MELTLGLFHQDSKTFKEVRKLSAGEYADYKEAASTLMRLLNDRDRFQDVLVAFVEYMDVVADHEDFPARAAALRRHGPEARTQQQAV